MKLKLLQLHKVGTRSVATATAVSSKLGLKTPSALLIRVLLTDGVGRLLNASSNTSLSRRLLSGVQVAASAALQSSPGCGESQALMVLYQWEPLVHGLSTSWAPFNRKITFLSAPADHKVKGWETSGICHKRGFVGERISNCCCQDPAALVCSSCSIHRVSLYLPCSLFLPLLSSPALLTLLIFSPSTASLLAPHTWFSRGRASRGA